MPRGYPTHIQKAFDELRFGPSRTLNLRVSLPTPMEGRARVETWLRGKQVERAGEVLIITGRGNHSAGGVSVVRQAVLALLPSLRRRNIITEWQEHTAGSFVVTLAPMAALFEAPRRRREPKAVASQSPSLPSTLAALAPETLSLLRRLAVASLALLGIHDVDRFVETEMVSKFSTLSTALLNQDDLESSDPETALRCAISHALEELEDLT